ncbi:MAG: preprotein translocase subunit SecD/SecF [Chitinophagaceae bacterium]|nr:preprotein translocase subunit SecD/SecF [Chitinophagaceae bacterium]
MQLKGLVRFFTIALILICLYQLSFTWFVRSHENKMEDKANAWVKANFPTPQQKYPDNKELQDLYQDTLDVEKDRRLRIILDSTKGKKIVFGLGTYQYAKQQELMLGLDLQGGISVTMEVGLDGLIKSLANNTKDPAFLTALNKAVQRKANSGSNLITLFGEEASAANIQLAPFFAGKSNDRVKFADNNDAVLSYLRTESTTAFNNTFNILRTRIDRFGVASPNINRDETKSIINIELAGARDPERVRRYLQSTANLQFFEVYNLDEVYPSIQRAEASIFNFNSGRPTTDTVKKDTSKQVVTRTGGDSNTTGKISDIDSGNKGVTAGAGANQVDSFPIQRIVALMNAQPGPDGKPQWPAALGVLRGRDTSVLNSYLNLPFVKDKFPANLAFMYGKPENKEAADNGELLLYAVKTLPNGEARLGGEMVSDATQDYDELGGVSIRMDMNNTGTRTWADMTEKNVGKPIAITLDNFVYSAPFVRGKIPNGSSSITGNYSIQEAQDLAQILKSGKLPAPARIVQEQVVGPTLGQESVEGGSLAFLISFGVIFALMLIYYNTGGWVANIALILNIFFTVGILSALNATLTAAGIAGLVLTIGMAVDTNVIIFERIKEELTKGKGYQAAVSDGYNRSLAPVLDGHITSLLTAIILFYFGLGPVLGFATTQIIGLLLSLFTGIMVSRMITDWYTNKKRHFQYFTPLSKRIFRHAAYKFVQYRKYAYGFSAIILLLGVGTYFNGFDQGVEFAGGRSYTVRFDKPQDIEQVRDRLKATFNESPVIKTVGSNSQLNITTAYLIHETSNRTDSTVKAKLYEGLQPFLGNVSYPAFASTQYLQSSQTVLPTISDDLKRGATYATLLALLVICLYIFMRFRDWRYSVGTIVALLHDVLVTLIVFSYLRNVVNFPLEIDQHFIAAILTVIGFSMNDTVIVYDRIREDSRLYPTMEKGALINRAINETLARTIITSVTVFLTILILFIFGGEVTRGFAFAMLIGVVTGSYSSIFVAAPILLDFARNKPLGNMREEKK